MRDKLLQIRVDDEFLSKLDYLKKVYGFKNAAKCIREIIEKEFRKEQEVNHGHWIDDEGQQVLMKDYIDKGENWKVCSVCGCGMCIGTKYKNDKRYTERFHNYCPNCGAKMDEDAND